MDSGARLLPTGLCCRYGGELFGLDGWRRRKDFFEIRSNPAWHRRPQRLASAFFLWLFYCGVAQRSHGGRVHPSVLFSWVSFRAPAAHAWLNPSNRCLVEIGIAVERNKKIPPQKKEKERKRRESILRLWKESRPQKSVFQRRRRSPGVVGFTPSSGGFMLISCRLHHQTSRRVTSAFICVYWRWLPVTPANY